MGEILVLRQDRSKIAWTIVISLGFVGIGVWMFLEPEGSARYPPELVKVLGPLMGAFFLWNGLLGVRALLDPAELVLTPQGFEVKGWRPKSLVPWSDVEKFSVTSFGLSKLVICTLTPKADSRFRQRRRGLAFGPINKAGLIPPRLEQSPDYACHVLEDWRRTYG